MSGAFWILFWWLAFGATHTILSSLTLRPRFIARLGERGFQGLYSLVAFATFIPLIWVYFGNKHAGPLLWNLANVPGVRPLAVALSGLAVVLLVLAFAQPSPTGLLPGVPRRAASPHHAPRCSWPSLCGRSPTCSSTASSATSSSAASSCTDSTAATIRTFASKPTAQMSAFYAETSLLPFAAILSGRNRLDGQSSRLPDSPSVSSWPCCSIPFTSSCSRLWLAARHRSCKSIAHRRWQYRHHHETDEPTPMA
jgi:uncharacterized membrane protein